MRKHFTDSFGPHPSRSLSKWQRAILLHLEMVERKGLAKMTQPALATELHTSITQIENSLRRLRQMGYVVVHEQAHGGRWGSKPQTYRLTYVPEDLSDGTD
jgi:hypothetical protein